MKPHEIKKDILKREFIKAKLMIRLSCKDEDITHWRDIIEYVKKEYPEHLI